MRSFPSIHNTLADRARDLRILAIMAGIPRSFFLLLLGAALILVWGAFVQSGGLDDINDALAKGRYPEPYDGVKTLIGIQTIDDAFMSMIAFNLPVLDESFTVGRIFMAQLVANVSVVPFIIAVEAHRGINCPVLM